MGRVQRSKAWHRWVIGLGVLAFASMGCSPSTLWFMAGGSERKQNAEYPLPPKDGKKDITVLILSTASPTLGVEFAGADREIAALIGKKMMDQSKDGKHPVKVIEQSKLQRFKNSHNNWQTLGTASIGKQLGADYVIEFNLEAISMFQAEFAREFCQGRAAMTVTVFDVDSPEAPKYTYPYNPQLPEKDVLSFPPAHYRQFMIDRFATELSWKNIPHVGGNEIANVR
ncbi:hypothetical protein [Fimbriiglobus ruber]|uniref:Lipoprotein n=1 Tax=Fimbriiglobus ruber TaxID=1908690 RepID=A0A225DAH5_9BACT|nr:hypothetical protein [Fimbriiglobus ruber]OWK38452.1 hypothetical protein FRUB_07572 [Fimbriiglobus ruber]